MNERTTYKQPDTGFQFSYGEPEYGSPAAKALERREKKGKQLNVLKKVGLRVGVSAAAAALVAGGSAALANRANAPVHQDKMVQINPNPETRKEVNSGELKLTPEQQQRVNEDARGTALALMQEVKGSGPDTRNGYGQLLFTKPDAKNGFGQALWVRAEKTVDGVHINVERADFKSPTGELGNEDIIVSQSFDFINPTTPVFKDGLLTSEEAAKIFNDPNTVLTNGTREIDGLDKEEAEIAVGKDGTVTAGKGKERTLNATSDGFNPLPSTKTSQETREVIEWIINK